MESTNNMEYERRSHRSQADAPGKARWRAEGDNIRCLNSRTSEGRGGIIKRITVSSWASLLEDKWPKWEAITFTIVRSRTTRLVRMKYVTRAITTNYALIPVHHFEFIGATSMNIEDAASHAATTPASVLWSHRYREVITIDNASVIEVGRVSGITRAEFNQSHGMLIRCTHTVHLSRATITSLAGEIFCQAVSFAKCPPPKPTPPTCLYVNGPWFAPVQRKSLRDTSVQASAVGCVNYRPHRVVALVFYSDYSCVSWKLVLATLTK